MTKNWVKAVLCVISACGERASWQEHAANVTVQRSGETMTVYLSLVGSYENPRAVPVTRSASCYESLEALGESDRGVLEFENWEALLNYSESARFLAQSAGVDCVQDIVGEPPISTRRYVVRGLVGGPAESLCFVRSDENRPETNAFLDLLDRIIDESIDCPGS